MFPWAKIFCRCSDAAAAAAMCSGSLRQSVVRHTLNSIIVARLAIRQSAAINIGKYFAAAVCGTLQRQSSHLQRQHSASAAAIPRQQRQSSYFLRQSRSGTQRQCDIAAAIAAAVQFKLKSTAAAVSLLSAASLFATGKLTVLYYLGLFDAIASLALPPSKFDNAFPRIGRAYTALQFDCSRITVVTAALCGNAAPHSTQLTTPAHFQTTFHAMDWHYPHPWALGGSLHVILKDVITVQPLTTLCGNVTAYAMN
ncbi:hypothetical protein C8R45DRAFT_933515 [Mycena sanguinolenta]|nr:hypothetical protein C8R45DRAFT_933515 [Mycena sanguinolenta]